MSAKVRLDRWLWAARFFKTRAQAKVAIDAGHVRLNGNRAKTAKEIGPGDELDFRRGWATRTVIVTAIAQQRGNATVAATLYAETPDSIERREAEAARRRMERAGLKVPDTKPDKRDRRALKRLQQSAE
ncbi:MAG: S4 domain-containing protein [Gammaproteobacteria bacterium]|nr:S4 domain-containing protein [Gammaproteobacteria bacterium]